MVIYGHTWAYVGQGRDNWPAPARYQALSFSFPGSYTDSSYFIDETEKTGIRA